MDAVFTAQEEWREQADAPGLGIDGVTPVGALGRLEGALDASADAGSIP